MLFRFFIVLHHFKLAGACSTVFGSRVENAGTLGALKLDLLALCFRHDVNLLDKSVCHAGRSENGQRARTIRENKT